MQFQLTKAGTSRVLLTILVVLFLSACGGGGSGGSSGGSSGGVSAQSSEQLSTNELSTNASIKQAAGSDAGGTGVPSLVAPVPGSTLSGSTATFQWSANGVNVTDWWLYVGASVGGKELHDSRSATADGLPTDGSTVWVRLWYETDDWYSVDYKYTAAAGGGTDTGSTDGGATGSSSRQEALTQGSTGSFDLKWTAPVSRKDGSPLSLSDINGFKVYYGKSKGKYTHYIDVSNGTAQKVKVKDVPVGTYYVVMTTYDSDGRESGYSSSITKTVL